SLGLDQKSDLWNRSHGAFSLAGRSDPGPLVHARHMLTGSYEHVPGQQVLGNPLFDEARLIVTALRLLKAGAVGAFALFSGADLGWMGQTVSAWPADELSVQGHESIYSLSESDIPQLRELTRAVRESESSLRIAFRRFNQGFGRESGEDRIIDCA